MSEQKTALELVDELISKENETPPTTTTKTYTDTHIALLKIKSAIERERAKDTEEYSALMNVSADRAGIINDLTAQLKSAITMRPISELPDRVPGRHTVVQLNSEWIMSASTDTVQHLGKSSDATHFYILPLPPAPERKLHPCYMPGCGGEAKIEKTFTSRQYVYCEQCGAHGPVCATMQEAKDAWGYA